MIYDIMSRIDEAMAHADNAGVWEVLNDARAELEQYTDTLEKIQALLEDQAMVWDDLLVYEIAYLLDQTFPTKGRSEVCDECGAPRGGHALQCSQSTRIEGNRFVEEKD